MSRTASAMACSVGVAHQHLAQLPGRRPAPRRRRPAAVAGAGRTRRSRCRASASRRASSRRVEAERAQQRRVRARPARRTPGTAGGPAAARPPRSATTRPGTARRPCRPAGSARTTASLVCSVVSTRWPVSEARSASSAVSVSRTSPTRTTSGSWRRTARRPRLKVMPVRSWTCTWVMPGQLHLDRVLEGDDVAVRGRGSRCSAAYSVLVLPLPVGPVMQHQALRGRAAPGAASASWSGVQPDVRQRLQPVGAARAAG